MIKELYAGSSVRVMHAGKLSDRFQVKSGVKQGCVLSPILFLIVINDILAVALQNKRGINWGLFDQLHDLDYADDICLLAHRHSDLQAMLTSLSAVGTSAGLKINAGKTKTMCINMSCQGNLSIGAESIEAVNSFRYLGSIVEADGGAESDVLARIKSAKGAFAMLRVVWNSNNFSTSTKLRLFKTNILSVLLYGCETWKVTNRIITGLQVFVNDCLRRIFKVNWLDRTSNEVLWERAKIAQIKDVICLRKWGWIGHTLRRDSTSIAKQALDWGPQGSRRVGRPRATWKRTVLEEAERVGKRWGEVKKDAQNRVRFRIFLETLRPSGD